MRPTPETYAAGVAVGSAPTGSVSKLPFAQNASFGRGGSGAVGSKPGSRMSETRAIDVAVPVAACSVYFDAIPPKKNAAFVRPAYTPPALQAVTRDFAFLVDAALPAHDLVRTVKGADKANVVAARVFDDFRGAGIPEGKKSLAIEVVLQPADRTYTEADLKGIADRIVAAAAKLGAELRG